MVVWQPSEDDDVIYVVEVQRCNELGLRFRQNPMGAVFCRKSVPPECISKVIEFQGNVLYQNDLLNQTAPGDRKANLDVGTSIKKASIYLQINQGMEEWPKNIVETDSAAREKKYYAAYDCNFNDEQMCAQCKQFCFKGIKFCTKCHKALQNSGQPG